VALRATARIVAADQPVSSRPRHDSHYRVADQYLRFWLRFIEPSLPDIARGRSDLALDRLHESWYDYRGQAVEPLIRDSVERISMSDPALAGVRVVGSYWTRTGDTEVDLIGVEQWPGAQRVLTVGSIKWRESGPFDRRDLASLAARQARVPGAESATLIAVSRSGCSARDLDRVSGPGDIVGAWR
jgi:uncharacterized protein